MRDEPFYVREIDRIRGKESQQVFSAVVAETGECNREAGSHVF